MKLFSRIFTAFILIALPATAFDVPPSFADLVEKLTPAVVNISTTQKVKGAPEGFQMFEMPENGEVPEEFKDFFDQLMKHPHGKGKGGKKEEQQIEREVYSLGSGFIIDENGYVVTNNHVINAAEEITVILSDDTKLKAKVIGRDAKTDLALLKVDAGHTLPAVKLGDSEKSRVGDWVIAIGNPFGLGGTVTAGIISARARDINSGPFDDYIQTDAAINRGNSGGPMFNMKGEVIGINTAIFSPSGGSIGIGFAVPTSLAEPVIKQLKATGHINRGWLGVKIQHVSDDIADSLGLPKAEGALVMEVTKDSPADKAGIQVGDVILHFDGKEVKDMRALPRIVADTKKGSNVPVEIWRKNASLTVHVAVGELQEKEEAASEESEEEQSDHKAPQHTKDILGMSVAALNAELREQFGIAQNVKGVVIMRLKEGSEVAKRGLQPGDVIMQLGDTKVTTTKDVSDAIVAARSAKHKFVLARVMHGNEPVFLPLPVEEKKGSSGK